MMEKSIYVKASVERKPEFRQLTVILENGDKRAVRKAPVGDVAREHVGDYVRNYTLLKNAMKYNPGKENGIDLIPCKATEDGSVEFPYLQDSTLMDLLTGKDPKTYLNKVLAFRTALVECFGTVPFRKSDAFYEVYGNITPADGADALSITNVDMIFDNVFCPDDHKYILIDYEWIFPFPLPLNYLLFRALLLDPTFSSYTEEERQTVLSGIGVNKDDETLYKRMELAFLNYVSPDIYKLDYFARIPGARQNVLHDFQHLISLPDALGKEIEASKRLNEEKAFYSSRLWFKIFNRLSLLQVKGKQKIKKKLKKNKLARKSYKGIRYLSKYGLMRTIDKVRHYQGAKNLEKKYTKKYIAEMNALRGTRVQENLSNIKFSIIVPLYNTPESFLREMIQSVQDQTYPNWELCLADGSDDKHPEVGTVCRELAEKDSRILYRKLEHNGGISENTNACLDMATGEYIALFDHDDLLHPSALYENAKVICEQDADFIYSDEVVFMSPNLENWTATHFKPDFSPENLLSNNYICHLSVFKASLLEKVGRFRKAFDGSQDHDMILRLTGCAQRIVHIPKVLYFWRNHPTSTASDIGSKTYAIRAGQNAVREYLSVNRHIETVVESVPEYPTMYHILFPIAGRPGVEIILDATGYRLQDIRLKIQHLKQNTQWKNVHITVVTGDDGDDTSLDPADGFCLLNTHEKSRAKRLNMAAMNSKNDYLVFLDMELNPLVNEWMNELLMYAQQEAIGAVGGRAYFADNTLRHGGLIIGLGDMRLVGRSHFGIERGNCGYFGQLAIAEDVSSVSAECMMIRREKFIQTGCFDEDYVDTLFDVDLCLRLLKSGYRNVYTPFADFIGGNPATFSIDYGSESPFYKKDAETLRKKQSEAIKRTDPYYNPNLALDAADYRLTYPPRI